MEVNVTQECIDRGVKKDAGFCPIALAIGALGYNDVHVEMDTVMVVDKDGYDYEGTLPQEAEDFISDFDFGNPVVPFTFNLVLEDVSDRWDDGDWDDGDEEDEDEG